MSQQKYCACHSVSLLVCSFFHCNSITRCRRTFRYKTAIRGQKRWPQYPTQQPSVFFHHLHPAFTFFLHSGKFRVQPERAKAELVDGLLKNMGHACELFIPNSGTQQWLSKTLWAHVNPPFLNQQKRLWSPAPCALQVASSIQQLPILAMDCHGWPIGTSMGRSLVLLISIGWLLPTEPWQNGLPEWHIASSSPPDYCN